MKRLVLEVSPLFGELAIEKVNNMYRLTQEDDMLYFTPSEIIHLTQIENPYTDKIVSINDEHKIHFYSLCPGFNIESESICLSINNWDNFITYIKYFYYSNERKHSLKWLKNCNAIITNACDQNDETVLSVSKCYEEGDVLTIRQIDDFRAHIVTFTKDEAIALKTYLDSVIPTMISK
ncbi:hypothetical protein ECO07P1_00230 [Escherichia phage ECO07P1]|nr:hypothetical protein ECO07P1_00230 [Escherichia phage ECO07P1]